MSSYVTRRDRPNHDATDETYVRPHAVGGATLTQRHVDRRDSGARASDHAVLDAAWGAIVQRDTTKPTVQHGDDERGGDQGPGPMPPPDKTDMKAHVVSREIRNGSLKVWIGLRVQDGVRPGMEGYLHNGDGKPNVRFKISHTDDIVSWCFLDVGEHQAVKDNLQVVLNPSSNTSSGPPVQKSTDTHSGLDNDGIRAAARHGISGAGGALPHVDAIQRSFGAHDVTGVRAYVGGAAREASEAMGAHAYATGNDVAFAASPSLFLAAHEAAHVVQQRAGVQLSSAVGQVGDVYEQHADAVATRVVAGESAEELLSSFTGVGGGGK